MKKLLTITIATLAITSCSKNKKTKCETGTVRFTCTSNNPYNVYIDGSYSFQIGANQFIEKELPKGYHAFKAEQASGYLLYPTVRTSSVTLSGCDDLEFSFP